MESRLGAGLWGGDTLGPEVGWSESEKMEGVLKEWAGRKT